MYCKFLGWDPFTRLTLLSTLLKGPRAQRLREYCIYVNAHKPQSHTHKRYMDTHTCTPMCADTHKHTRSQIQACTYGRTCTETYSHTHTHTCINTCTHTFILYTFLISGSQAGLAEPGTQGGVSIAVHHTMLNFLHYLLSHSCVYQL